MSDCRFGVSPVNYPDPDPDPEPTDGTDYPANPCNLISVSNILFLDSTASLSNAQFLDEVEPFFFRTPEDRFCCDGAHLGLVTCTIRTSRLLLRLSWCGRSSYLPFFMPVRAGPWQQKSGEGSKPLRWGAIRDFWTFPTKTMWRTRRFATESRMQMECMMIS